MDLRQKQTDSSIRSIAFSSKYPNDTEKNFSVRELEFSAVVWGLEDFRFYLYSKIVYFYTNHQTLEPIIKRNRAYQQYSAGLTSWLDGLAQFDISK